MTIQFKCKHCGCETAVSEEYAGMSGDCTKCGRAITIPALKVVSSGKIKSSHIGWIVALPAIYPIILFILFVCVFGLLFLVVSCTS